MCCVYVIYLCVFVIASSPIALCVDVCLCVSNARFLLVSPLSTPISALPSSFSCYVHATFNILYVDGCVEGCNAFLVVVVVLAVVLWPFVV